METEDKTADSLPWQKDLRKIQNLKDNWDNEGACAINRLAIKNVQHLMKTAYPFCESTTWAKKSFSKNVKMMVMW